jgi:hypothetical protein
MLIVGVVGVEMDIVGPSGKLMVGTDGSSGKFMVGIEGAESGKLMTGAETAASFTWTEEASGR